MSKFRIVRLYFIVGLATPLVLLLNAYVVPSLYSHPLIKVAMAPKYLLPFLQNRETLEQLTYFVFGRQTANYAPITILILIFFWAMLAVVLLYVVRVFLNKKRAHNQTIKADEITAGGSR